MYHDDHNPPHFHAVYQEYEALIEIKSSTILEGKLPKRAKNLIEEWALQNQDELFENWERAINFLPLKRIKGADDD
jgi:hypothetical protein